MKMALFSAIVALAMAIGTAQAKHYDRTATFTSNAVAESGQCTVEVMVPGQARVRIEGTSASMLKLSGRDPVWRKFECSSPLPEKPKDFRLETLGGRGHQELVHGPRHH